MTTRVIGYVRVSDPRQTENYSLEAQRRSIALACESHGHELLRICADEGRSAFRDDLRKRPALREAIAAVLAGEADALAVDKLDRLARNAKLFHEILFQLNRRVIFVRENIDPTTPTGELVAGMLASAAQFFSRNLGVESKKGKDERVRGGLYLGRLPYAYAKGDEAGKVPPVLDDAPRYVLPDGRQWSPVDVVRWVFERAADGRTGREIVRQILDLGIDDVSHARVRFMLRSRFYCGFLPRRRNSRTEGAEEWVPGAQPPIISEDLFELVAQRRRENRKGIGGRTRRPIYPLSGLAKCGRCGSPMYCQRDRHVIRLLCGGRHTAGGCTQPSVRMSRIEAQVLRALAAYAPPPEICEQIAGIVNAGREDTSAEEGKLREQQRRLDDLFLAYHRMEDAEYRARSAAIAEQLAQLRVRSREVDVMELAEMLHDLPGTYEAGEPRTQNELARAVFRELLVDSQELVAVRVQPGIDAMLRGSITVLELEHGCSSDAQFPCSRDSAAHLRALPDGWWAIPPSGGGISSYPKIPRALWPQLAAERAAGLSLPELARRWNVRSHRTVRLILLKYEADGGLPYDPHAANFSTRKEE